MAFGSITKNIPILQKQRLRFLKVKRSPGLCNELMADHVLEVERDLEVTRLVEGWSVGDVIFSKEKFLICQVLLMGFLEMASQHFS